MTEKLAAAYDEAGRRFGMPVAHAGKAFADHRAKDPDAELYDPDGSHPLYKGSEVAAETILATMLG